MLAARSLQTASLWWHCQSTRQTPQEPRFSEGHCRFWPSVRAQHMLWILKRLVWIFTRPERQREVEACTIYYTILCKKVKWYFKQSHSLGKFRHAPRTNGTSEWFWHLLMFISLYVCKSENLTVSYLYQILELNRQVFLSKRVSPTQQLQQRKGKKGLTVWFAQCICVLSLSEFPFGFPAPVAQMALPSGLWRSGWSPSRWASTVKTSA